MSPCMMGLPNVNWDWSMACNNDPAAGKAASRTGRSRLLSCPPQGAAAAGEGIEGLMQRAAGFESSGAAARLAGDEKAADGHFRSALALALEAAGRWAESGSINRLEILHAAARLSLECGQADQARQIVDEALAAGASIGDDEWAQLSDASAWPDGWLMAVIRPDPPDLEALDALTQRYWKPLFARCRLLMLNREKAADLAQDAWCRVLRNRRALKPGGNFPAYLTAVATNLWRDRNRSARRAGPMAEHRMSSLDAPLAADGDESRVLGNFLPDLDSLGAEQQRLLAMDIDRALASLTTQLRDVLVSRVVEGESCAEIGRRYQRTEQCISGWVRQAIRQMKAYIEGAGLEAGKE